MAAVNVVEARATCPRCARLVGWRVQFRYGLTWEYTYRVGDRLRWGRDFPEARHARRADVGRPGARLVVALGTPEGCPACGYGVAELLDDEVWIADDRIAAVRRASGRYQFGDAGYVVLSPPAGAAGDGGGATRRVRLERDPLLRRYWIVFTRPAAEPGGIRVTSWPPGACGVTAYSHEDARALLEELGIAWERLFPPIARIVEDIDLSTLPASAVAGIAPPIWRGLWYWGWPETAGAARRGGAMRRDSHLDWILASMRSYRAGRLDLAGLAANVAVEASALEGAVGESVRHAMLLLAARLDALAEEEAFLADVDTARVEAALREAEAAISHDLNELPFSAVP